MKKIAVLTGTRAEYGLLRPLIQEIICSSDFEYRLIVTGSHLSPEFGLTYNEIEKDGFEISKKIEILLSSDTPVGLSKAMGLAQISAAEYLDEEKPDYLLVLGDRYEVLPFAAAAMLCRIPIIHIHGGETTEGLIDEAIRHSISKMAHLHFTSTEDYRKRVIQLGENPERVFNVGAIGLDNILSTEYFSRDELEKDLSFKFKNKNILITYHPVTLESSTSKEQFEELLAALSEVPDTLLIFTQANADTDGRIINQLIEKYVQANPGNAIMFKTLGTRRYLSMLREVDVVLGNSSSALIEVPSFKKATINIGDRQKGRVQASSVLNCCPIKKEILKAIKKAYSTDFVKIVSEVINPYGKGGTAKKIIGILNSFNNENLLKKKFYDISF